jgi:hypothetical protein
MPFKANADRRHRIPKQRRQIEGLIGSIIRLSRL